MGNERKKCVQKKKQAAQHEDAAMKVVMQYFAEDLLPYWGIHYSWKGKIYCAHRVCAS